MTEQTSTEQKILRRVRALLAQAEDPACTPEEAAAFSAKAEELIVRHAVDAALLAEKAGPGRGKPTMREYEPQAPYAKAKGTLLNAIALAHGCRVIRRGSDGQYLTLGFESDLALVDILYTSLLIQGLNGSARGDKSYRTSFWYGFAARVGARLEAMRNRAANETGAALVLADRTSEVDAHLAEMFPRVRTTSRATIRNGAGWRAGQEAGERADLGTKRFSPSAKALA